MKTLSISLSALASLALGCSAGDASNGGGADAAPINPEVQCATEYETTGDVVHTVKPSEGSSCDPGGTWSIQLSNPGPGPIKRACEDAPESASFTLIVQVQSIEAREYTVTDQEDPDREWEVRFNDKGGSCSASLELRGDGFEWSLHPSEDGRDGPLGGTSRYELVQ